MRERPIENCYWVVPGQFLAGEYPRDRDDESSRETIAAFISAGVSDFVDLTRVDDGLEPYSHLLPAPGEGAVAYHTFPIQDCAVPLARQQMVDILDTIDAAIAAGRTVYVHCWGGVGRTGTVVGCWLSRHGFRGEDALSQLRGLWQHCPRSATRRSPETDEQIDYVRDWDES